MHTKKDQSQSNGTDHNTRGTNRENHKSQKTSCQCSKRGKKSHNRHGVQQLVCFIIYSLIFVALAMATLITQNYTLLSVISMMAMGLVSSLYHVIGAPPPKFLSNPLDSKRNDDHKT